MRRIATRLGELECQVVEGVPEGQKPDLVVVLCHGFGAPASDLVPLAWELVELRPELGPRVRWVFPGAPLTLAEWGMPQARAWFQLPPEVMRGGPRDFESFARWVPEGLAPARRAVMGVVSAVSAATGLPYGRIVLGGFSQGAMVTTEVALKLEEPPAGLCILSGTVLNEEEWRRRAPARKGLPVLQGHGRYDAVLPYPPAERLRDLLVEAGLAVEFVPFDGPHTIGPEELERLGAFLSTLQGAGGGLSSR